MIIITGPGRSGTSLLAALYQHFGYDPGGNWRPEVNAGLESYDVVAINHSIARDLGVTVGTGKSVQRAHISDYVGDSLAASIKRHIPADAVEVIRRRFIVLPWRREYRVKLVKWSVVASVARKYRKQLNDLASEKTVVKDPNFSWTLPVWLEAQAPISNVIVATREIERMVASRYSSRLTGIASETNARNTMIYGLGLCLSSAWDHGVDVRLLRYPDFLADIPSLQRSLPLLEGLDAETFRIGAERVIRPDLVH